MKREALLESCAYNQKRLGGIAESKLFNEAEN